MTPREFVEGFDNTNRFGAERRQCAVHRLFQCGQCDAGRPEPRGSRHLDIVEDNIRRGTAIPGTVCRCFDTSGLRTDHEQRQAAGRFVPRGHNQHVSDRSVQHYRLAAVQEIDALAASGSRADVIEHVARAGLMVSQRTPHSSSRNLGQQDSSLHHRAVIADEATAQYHGAQERLEHQPAAQFLHHEHNFDGATVAAGILRQTQAEDALPRQEAPDFRAGAVWGFEERLPALERVLPRDQPPHGVTQHGLVFGEFKFHG